MSRTAHSPSVESARSASSERPWSRQFHRWVSMIFTLTVAANFLAMTQGTPPAWITYAPLAPLAMLFGTGLVLFVAPYRSRWRRRQNRRQL